MMCDSGRVRTVVNQFYGADILMEYVIRGNAAVLKCSIPSFVADFVRVESWIDELGTVLLPPTDNNYGVLGRQNERDDEIMRATNAKFQPPPPRPTTFLCT